MTRVEKQKKVMTSTCKENQLSEKSLKLLEFFRTAFGELVVDYTKERLVELNERMQSDLIWRVLHYAFRDEIMTTGNIDADIKLAEIVEKLPFLSVLAVRHFEGYDIENMKSHSESPEYDKGSFVCLFAFIRLYISGRQTNRQTNHGYIYIFQDD